MAGMQLWASRANGSSGDSELIATIGRHREGRLVFELAQGPVELAAFLVVPAANFAGEMSVCGFEIS
jgi:hypothetical protein